MSESHSTSINDERVAIERAANNFKREVAIKDLRIKIAEIAKRDPHTHIRTEPPGNGEAAWTFTNAEVVLLDEYITSLHRYLADEMRMCREGAKVIERVLRGLT